LLSSQSANDSKQKEALKAVHKPATVLMNMKEDQVEGHPPALRSLTSDDSTALNSVSTISQMNDNVYNRQPLID
jgi:hypothetical protein